MPRAISTTFRGVVEARYSGEIIVAFVTITHADLDPPLRLACEVPLGRTYYDYIYGGERFTGCPLILGLVSDDERYPRTTLGIPDVDGEIAEALGAISDPVQVKVEIILGSEFDDYDSGENARLPIGTPTVEFVQDELTLINVECDPIVVSGELAGNDHSSEPYPRTRATSDRLPGLYRR